MKYITSSQTSCNSSKQDSSCIKRTLRNNKEKSQLQLSFNFLMSSTTIGKCTVSFLNSFRIPKIKKQRRCLNCKPFRKALRYLRKNILLTLPYTNPN